MTTMSEETAVNNLLSLYCQLLDSGNANQFADLWLPDGTLEIVKINKTYEGAEVKDFVAFIKEKLPGAYHFESNIVLGRGGTWWTNYSYWHSYKDGQLLSYGQHEDLIQVSHGVARFKSRVVRHFHPS